MRQYLIGQRGSTTFELETIYYYYAKRHIQPSLLYVTITGYDKQQGSCMLYKKNDSAPISRVLSPVATFATTGVSSFIYAVSHLTALASRLSILPSIEVHKKHRAGRPIMSMVYLNLQPPADTARTVTSRLVVSYTAFSPLQPIRD